MADVRIGHEQIIRSKAGNAAALGGSTADGHTFADRVIVADLHLSGLAVVLQILRLHAYGGKGEDPVAFANAGMAIENHMGDECATLA